MALPDPRHRLMEAMTEAVSEHGYPKTAVSQITLLAGSSRTTFYENFSSREACFLSAYRRERGAVRSAVREAAGARSPAERPEAVLDAIVRELDANPAAARLILVEALATPPPIRREHEAWIFGIENEVASFLDTQASAALQIPAAALLGGIGEVLATRLLLAPPESFGELGGELAKWMNGYRLSDDAAPLAQRHWRELGRFAPEIEPAEQSAGLLPRGRSALPAQAVAAARRDRILEAAVHLVATEGYSALTVARIAEEARVPRSAFYSHFETKDEMLLAAQTEGLQGAMGVVAAAYSPPAPWPQRVWRGLAAFLACVAEHPAHAQLDFVESYAAGRAATLLRQRNRMAFTLFLEEGYRETARGLELSRFCSEAIAAAIFGLMRRLIVEGRTAQMLSLLPAAAYTALAPFMGPQAAAEQVESWIREGR